MLGVAFSSYPDKVFNIFSVMAGAAPEGSQFDARQYDAKMQEL